MRDPEPTTGVCFSPDGSRLAVSCNDRHAVRVWDLRALRRGLVELNLAGAWPNYPDADPPADPAPLTVEVLPGTLRPAR